MRFHYRPPDAEVIDEYAKTVCIQLAQQIDPSYAAHDVVLGFSDFVKLVLKLQAKRLNNEGHAHVDGIE